MKRHGQLIACLVCLVLSFPASAQRRIDPAGIDGALLLAGSYDVAPAAFEKFVELAGGGRAKIVIVKVGDRDPVGGFIEGLTKAIKKFGADELRVEESENVKQAFPETTGAWLYVSSLPAWSKTVKDGFLANECRALLKRGGVIGAAAEVSAMLASDTTAIARPIPLLALLPDSLIDPVPKIKEATSVPERLKKLKGIVGYEIDRDGAMLVKGRTISVVGDGAVHLYVGSRAITLKGKQREDLTALRRAALDLSQGFPPKSPEPPIVEKGTLVIVGGGGSPDGLYKKFVEYAGGEGKACIAIFATANPDPLPKRDSVAAAFKKAGAKKATVLYGKTRSEVESKEFLDTLKESTGLWFDGGRQWRFVDCYENTTALPAMVDVLNRGGVIGGTSAGATIQGDYLCRGGVFNNFDIRYEGYERGLGFLKGVAIDQHFTQRNRQPEMTKLMKTYPQYLGIGLDEATAIVVKGQIAEVMGKGNVHFYDSNRKIAAGESDFVALSTGARYDLKERKIVAAPK